MNYFPGYGFLGPIFDGRNARIPQVAPVSFPASPGSPPPVGTGPAPMAGAGAAPPGLMPLVGAGAAPSGAGAALPQGRHNLLRAPAGSPLAALANTGLAAHLGPILANAPQLAMPQGPGLPGQGAIPMPPQLAGMPQMPPPPAGMFGGVSGGVPLGSTAPVQVPAWYFEQQQRLGSV